MTVAPCDLCTGTRFIGLTGVEAQGCSSSGWEREAREAREATSPSEGAFSLLSERARRLGVFFRQYELVQYS